MIPDSRPCAFANHMLLDLVLQRVVQLITSIFSLLLLAQEILVGMDIGDSLSCGGRTSV